MSDVGWLSPGGAHHREGVYEHETSLPSRFASRELGFVDVDVDVVVVVIAFCRRPRSNPATKVVPAAETTLLFPR